MVPSSAPSPTPIRGRRSRWLIGLLFLWLCVSGAQASIVTEITGLANEQLANARAHLDLVRFADRDDLSAAAVRRLFELAPMQIRNALRPFGFYDPQIEGSLQNVDGVWYARFTVNPGLPVRLTSVDVRVEGPGGNHPAFAQILSTSPLVMGRQLYHWEFDQLRTRLDRAAQTYGFFDRAFVQSTLEVNPTERSARATLVMHTGEPYRFGQVTVDQDILHEGLIDRLLIARPGDLYSNDAVLRTQYALTDSNYFSNVLVSTGVRDPLTRTVPVHVATAPIPAQQTRFGLGYGSDTHVRVSVSQDWRRLNQFGHRANLQARASWQQYSISGQYLIPIGNPLQETLGIRASLIQESLGATDSQRGLIGLNHRRVMGIQQRNIFIDLIHERTSVPGEPSFRETYIVPGVSFERLVADNPIRPSQGYFMRAELRGSHSVLLSNNDFLRFNAAVTGIYSPFERLRLVARAEIGVGLVADASEIPASLRFFAGGDTSVRGYAFNSLGPTDADGRVIGGRHLIFGSVEAQFNVHPWVDLAVFVDTGNAINDWNDRLQTSAGLGVHVLTPVGRLRVEFARSLTEDRNWRLHLSIRPDL